MDRRARLRRRALADVVAAAAGLGWGVGGGVAAAEPRPAGEPARHVRWFRELAFRRRKGRYVFLWHTERSWAGTCRQFMLKLGDGTVHRADFEFARGALGRRAADTG